MQEVEGGEPEAAAVVVAVEEEVWEVQGVQEVREAGCFMPVLLVR